MIKTAVNIGWANNNKFAYDHSLARVNGTFSTDKVGHYGLVILATDKVLPAGSLGYPSAPPFFGHTLHVVAPIELIQGIPPTNVIGVYPIYSNMTEGSSG